MLVEPAANAVCAPPLRSHVYLSASRGKRKKLKSGRLLYVLVQNTAAQLRLDFLDFAANILKQITFRHTHYKTTSEPQLVTYHQQLNSSLSQRWYGGASCQQL